jgi:hypothetical protein
MLNPLVKYGVTSGALAALGLCGYLATRVNKAEAATPAAEGLFGCVELRVPEAGSSRLAELILETREASTLSGGDLRPYFNALDQEQYRLGLDGNAMAARVRAVDAAIDACAAE